MLCIAGKNDIAVNSLNYILENDLVDKSNICVLVNKTDHGEDTWQKSLLKYAQEHEIMVSTLEQIYTIEDLIFISLEYDTIIKPTYFKTDQLYNIHFSKLPSYKGMYTSVMPLLNGENTSGVTLHKIDSGIDTGDIIEQITFDITVEDTARDLYYNYLHYGFQLFKTKISDIINGNILAHPQNKLQSTYYSKAAISFSSISIDLNKTGYEIHNQLRAFIFPEYQLPIFESKKIWRSELTDLRNQTKKIVWNDNYVSIKGIDNYVVKAYFVK